MATRKRPAEKSKGGRRPIAERGRSFGQIRELPSGRFQASYPDPDGRTYLARTRNGDEVAKKVRHVAPVTYETRGDAEGWLTDEGRLISAGTWSPPAVRLAARTSKRHTFGEYSEAWLTNRRVKGRPLADRTRDHYRDLLERYILPTFSDVVLTEITPDEIDHWYGLTAIGKPTTQAHAYSLLRTILGTAVDRGIIKTANPAKIRGGGQVERESETRTATLDELAVIVAAMPERRRLMVLLAAWCGLRLGELTELRRNDVDIKKGVIRVRRGVVRVKERAEDGVVRTVHKVKDPKSKAGRRDVPIPPHLLDDIRAHLLAHTQPDNGLLFATREGNHLSASAFYGKVATLNPDGSVKRAGTGWFEARRQAGREDLRFHDLRHTGLTNAAIAGATLKELMQLAGHSEARTVMRYQHAAEDRMQDLAAKLSAMATGLQP